MPRLSFIKVFISIIVVDIVDDIDEGIVIRRGYCDFSRVRY
jgi:hypothetical protein